MNIFLPSIKYAVFTFVELHAQSYLSSLKRSSFDPAPGIVPLLRKGPENRPTDCRYPPPFLWTSNFYLSQS